MVTVRDYDRLTTFYKSQYEKKYGHKAFINRQSASWVWKSILQDYNTKELENLIEFFFEHYTHSDHDFKWFQYNYEKIDEAREKRDAEAKHIAKLQVESQDRIKEYEATLERIKSNRSNN